MDSPDAPHKPVYWSISEECLMDMLREVAAGGDPEMVYMTRYANATITTVDPDE